MEGPMRDRLAYASLLVFLGSCGGPTTTAENPLGIARFEFDETDDKTTIVGWSTDGQEIARLELVHGRFVLSDWFAEGYEDRNVVGRKLNVTVLGQRMDWETEGFSPTTAIPAHPPNQWALATFLEDDHVRPTLALHGIGFQPLPEKAARDWGPSPYSCDVNGTHPR